MYALKAQQPSLFRNVLHERKRMRVGKRRKQNRAAGWFETVPGLETWDGLVLKTYERAPEQMHGNKASYFVMGT